jgi:hypothetical protein
MRCPSYPNKVSSKDYLVAVLDSWTEKNYVSIRHWIYVYHDITYLSNLSSRVRLKELFYSTIFFHFKIFYEPLIYYQGTS